MSKFKVGDRVLVIGPVRTADVAVGHVGMISDVNPAGIVGGYSGVIYKIDNIIGGWVGEDAITNTLTPGQTYTSKNGRKWECIFTRDGKAWLVGVFDGKAHGSAYEFDVDGTAPWVMERHRASYNIVFEPVRTTHYHKVFAHGEVRNTKYDVVDGRVDWDSLEILPCD